MVREVESALQVFICIAKKKFKEKTTIKKRFVCTGMCSRWHCVRSILSREQLSWYASCSINSKMQPEEKKAATTDNRWLDYSSAICLNALVNQTQHVQSHCLLKSKKMKLPIANRTVSSRIAANEKKKKRSAPSGVFAIPKTKKKPSSTQKDSLLTPNGRASQPTHSSKTKAETPFHVLAWFGPRTAPIAIDENRMCAMSLKLAPCLHPTTNRQLCQSNGFQIE